MKKFKVIFAALAVVGMIAFFGLRNEAKSVCVSFGSTGICHIERGECVALAFGSGDCSVLLSNPKLQQK